MAKFDRIHGVGIALLAAAACTYSVGDVVHDAVDGVDAGANADGGGDASSIVLMPASSLVVNEVDGHLGEWVELGNPEANDVDVAGIRLLLEASDASVVFPSRRVAAHGFVVVAGTVCPDASAAADCVLAGSGWQIPNRDGGTWVRVVGVDGGVLDREDYPGGLSAGSWARYPDFIGSFDERTETPGAPNAMQ